MIHQQVTHIPRPTTPNVPFHLSKSGQTLVFVTTAGLVFLSIVLFFVNFICSQVNTLVDAQNDESIKLRRNLEYFSHYSADDKSLPLGLLEDLIKFSRTNQTIVRASYRLNPRNMFILAANWKDIKTDIETVIGRTVELDNLTIDPNIKSHQILQTGFDQISLFQKIRAYALDGSVFNKSYAMAISTYIMPCFYAMVGAFLYVCRKHTCVINGHGSRYAMAFILGATTSVIGSLIPKDALLPPLAIAFVAGYSIDAVISQLDYLVDKMKRSPNEQASEEQLQKPLEVATSAPATAPQTKALVGYASSDPAPAQGRLRLAPA